MIHSIDPRNGILFFNLDFISFFEANHLRHLMPHHVMSRNKSFALYPVQDEDEARTVQSSPVQSTNISLFP
jgi:hypothetical protein